MDAPQPGPRFRRLDPDEALALLQRNHVGRLAYARGGRVDIEPLHYVYDEGWLYGRTSEGTKIETTGKEWWPVAFEVDEIESMFEWRSVVVQGGFYVLKQDDPRQEDLRTFAIERLRTLVPAALTDGDPTPDRTLVFRISVQDIEGREATSR